MNIRMKRVYLSNGAAMLLAGLLSTTSLFAYRNKDVEPVPLIAGYKQWTRVNPVPDVFHSQIAIQCVMPTVQQSQMEKANPHRDKFITVYVNNIGRSMQ